MGNWKFIQWCRNRCRSHENKLSQKYEQETIIKIKECKCETQICKDHTKCQFMKDDDNSKSGALYLTMTNSPQSIETIVVGTAKYDGKPFCCTRCRTCELTFIEYDKDNDIMVLQDLDGNRFNYNYASALAFTEK